MLQNYIVNQEAGIVLFDSYKASSKVMTDEQSLFHFSHLSSKQLENQWMNYQCIC